MYVVNLPLFRLSCRDGDDEAVPAARGARTAPPGVSVLIPARDEAEGITACVRSVLASRDVRVEVVVWDDQSQDETAQLVQGIAAEDPRVRLLHGTALPAGWNGKQHACWRLSEHASQRWLGFLDADVRLHPQALSTMLRYAMRRDVALLSAFPRQQTGTILEKLLIPMMHVVLLGYLPMPRMRRSRSPAYAAGCGQLFLTERTAYQAMGTHRAIRSSRHDGIHLPSAYRKAGLSTDVIDGTSLATCRMYRGAREVVHGLLKNADEGIANAGRIVPFSVLLLGSGVLPWGLLIALAWKAPVVAYVDTSALWIGTLVAVVAGVLPRWINAWLFKQSWLGAALHPVAVTLFIALQWWALAMQLCGKRVQWRGRD